MEPKIIEIIRNENVCRIEKDQVKRKMESLQEIDPKNEIVQEILKRWNKICAISFEDRVYLQEEKPWIYVYHGADPIQKKVEIPKTEKILWAVMLGLTD